MTGRFVSDQGVSGLTPPQDFQQIPVGPRRLRSGRYRAVQLGPGEIGVGGPPPVETFNEHAYARFNGDFQVEVPIAPNPSRLALPGTASPRNALILRNSSTGAQNVFVSFGSGATLASALRLTPGTQVLFDSVVPQDDIYCFADAAGATLAIAVSTVANGVLT